VSVVADNEVYKDALAVVIAIELLIESDGQQSLNNLEASQS
jgi:hypothetical protein